MKITIHQPEHMPWLGFFHKIAQADTVVLLDNVQFRKNYYQNRNKIRTADGWAWVTVPVSHNLKTLIKDVAVVPDRRWKKKWCDSIFHAYLKSRHFNDYYGGIKKVVDTDVGLLSDINIRLINTICGFLGIKTDFVRASQMGMEGSGSDLIFSICRKLKADTYISGISGRDYLELDSFRKCGTEVVFQEFHHPVYKQLFEPFIPCMSIIDLIFNYGDKSLEIINGTGVPVMEKVFL